MKCDFYQFFVIVDKDCEGGSKFDITGYGVLPIPSEERQIALLSLNTKNN